MRDLVRAHALEEIVPGIVLADMVKAKEPPRARAVEVRGLQWRLEFAG